MRVRHGQFNVRGLRRPPGNHNCSIGRGAPRTATVTTFTQLLNSADPALFGGAGLYNCNRIAAAACFARRESSSVSGFGVPTRPELPPDVTVTVWSGGIRMDWVVGLSISAAGPLPVSYTHLTLPTSGRV